MSCKRVMIAAGIAITVSLLAGCGQKGPDPSSKKNEAVPSPARIVTVVPVISQVLTRERRLPGEISAYQDVALYPKVQGFIQWVGVDRGSVVKRGQLLIRMVAPELASHRNEAEAKARSFQAQLLEGESKLQSIRAQRLEAEAKFASDEATHRRLKAASAKPGVVAGNELEMAQRAMEGSQARVRLWEANEKAGEAQLKALQEVDKAAHEAASSVQSIESYLRVTAPFDGVVTERNVHVGSLVGSSGGAGTPAMLRVQQVSQLRLVVAVPEMEVPGVKPGTRINFTVPAFPGDTFSGTVQRVARALEIKTRTMPVELDVDNRSGRLAPGMFAEVAWQAQRPTPSLFVPSTAIATTTERTFVIRVRNEAAEWVDVKRGTSMGGLVEVFGSLHEGELVAERATDELRAGTRVIARQTSPAH